MNNILMGIFLKEVVKTRTCMIALLLASVAVLAWLGLDIRQLFLMDHPEIVWYRVMDIGQPPYRTLAYLPAICGLIFACFQFLPEMRDERLRISLHLPCGLAGLMLAHLFFGAVYLCLLYAVDALLLYLLLANHFPIELLCTALSTALPWFVAGIYTYLCTTYVILEPRKRTKLTGLLLGVCICVPLLAKAAQGSMLMMMPLFLIGLPLLFIGLLLPALHFRYRRVD